MVQTFTVSRDDSIYEAWPDVALTPSGKLVCIFSECTHHMNREYTRIMLADSTDRGRTWTDKRPLTESLYKSRGGRWWNCARLRVLDDGRLAAIADRLGGENEGNQKRGVQENLIWFSADDGAHWDGPHKLPAVGIVPDRLLELRCGPQAGRWIVSAHTMQGNPTGQPRQRCWISDDRGGTWSEPSIVGEAPDLKLCEGSILELPGGELVCFMRENSGQGWPAYKSISRDGGRTWGAVTRFPLPACHRPVAMMLQSGQALITFSMRHGGVPCRDVVLAGYTDVDSCLSEDFAQTRVRLLPLDHDRHQAADGGYTGPVQFDDGEIYVVNYIMDDAPKAQIRGYALHEREIVLPDPEAR